MQPLKTMKTNTLFIFLGIVTAVSAMVGTAVAGPSGGYTFASLLGFSTGCPMRTPETKLVFVNTSKNMGLSRIVTGYRCTGMCWQDREDDDMSGVQPLVPSDDQKLIRLKASGRLEVSPSLA
jgi:hypothetical protein